MTSDTVVGAASKPLTIEDLLVVVREILTESDARIAANFAKSDAIFKANLAESSARIEKEIAKTNAESDARIAEILAESSARIEAIFAKSGAESDAKIAANFAKSNEKFDQSYKKLMESQVALNKQLGGMANSNGDMAQDFFFNALFYRKTLFGQVFDKVETVKRKIKKTGIDVQYDIMLVNGKSVCIVEVKYKATTLDVNRIANKYEKHFREGFPEHADKKLYLAIASMSFDPCVENECKNHGFAIIKQVGDTIEIYDEHLKVF